MPFGQPTVEHVSQFAPGNSSTTTLPLLVNTVLFFIKAFRLKGNKDSLRMIVTEHFSSNEVEGAKRLLWDSCKLNLEACGMTFTPGGTLIEGISLLQT